MFLVVGHAVPVSRNYLALLVPAVCSLLACVEAVVPERTPLLQLGCMSSLLLLRVDVLRLVCSRVGDHEVLSWGGQAAVTT